MDIRSSVAAARSDILFRAVCALIASHPDPKRALACWQEAAAYELRDAPMPNPGEKAYRDARNGSTKLLDGKFREAAGV